ncbi:hypothetical protein SAMN04487907_11511 [Zunongwangia mangrovi]|uniref:Uncharacterized protein n=1 Tax=Zunongwangia mangrovi TaxID=1334022 RepID=A0A1I1N5L6_9FLAO|nr:hypothetical protein [Zunongwangia mangrovi]SFC92745.1 hypothetical protein SAMN04487907_11511 [Zunongwangia mangrovi]
MKLFFRTIIGFMLAILAILPFIFLGLSLYDAFHNFYGIIAVGVISILSLWIAYGIFKLIKGQGILKILSYPYSSPEMDKLKK